MPELRIIVNIGNFH